jgi:hypothetical protein
LPQRLWRFDIRVGYGPLEQAAWGRIDVDKIATHQVGHVPGGGVDPVR